MEKMLKGYIETKTEILSDRVIRFKVSSEIKDRAGEVVKATNWNINNYIKNPVMLWAHSYDELPIARAVAYEFTGTDKYIDYEFASKELNDFGDTVYKMYKGGFLNAVSIGYQPDRKKQKVDGDTLITDGIELLEVSAVPVPANPEALMIGKCFKPEDNDIDNIEKVGRVISSKNEKTIKSAIDMMTECVKVLSEVIQLTEDETEKGIMSEILKVAADKRNAIIDNVSENIKALKQIINK